MADTYGDATTHIIILDAHAILNTHTNIDAAQFLIWSLGNLLDSILAVNGLKNEMLNIWHP